MQRKIQKIETTKLASGESDPGAIPGLTLIGGPEVYTGLGASGDEKRIYRFYTDDTEFPVWAPDSEASVELWLDASDGATITETSGDVTVFADKSGNGNDLSNSGTVRTGDDTIDGKNVLSFGGSSYMTGSASGMGSDFMLIFVAEAVSVSGSFQSMFGYRGGAFNGFDIRAGAGSTFRAEILSDEVNTGNGLLTPSGYPYPGPAVYAFVFNKTSDTVEIFINGESKGSTDFPGAMDASGTVWMFSNRDALDLLAGKFAEGALFAGDVTSTVRQKCEGYLAHGWGLAADLVGGHPYEALPPTS